MGVRQLLDLGGKVALITGGSRGLGLQMAEALGEMGARVAITARKAEELAQARARLERQGIEVLTVANDLAQPGAVPALVDTVLAHLGSIDILVNNAGASWGAPAVDYPDEAWHKVMRLNVDAVFLLCREVARRVMIPRRAGKIVNIASTAGLSGGRPEMQAVAYYTSKAALINLTRALASEWGRHNLNVNAICPGFFPTRMSQGLLDSIGAWALSMIPLGRFGGDEDLKGLVVLLSSEAGRHLTGQVIAVDGGESAC